MNEALGKQWDTDPVFCVSRLSPLFSLTPVPPFPAPQPPFAGKSSFLAESLVHSSEGAPILA